MSNRRRHVLYALTGCAIALIVMTTVYSALVSAWTSTQIRQTQKSTHSTISVIRDCTIPTGKCYLRGQAQQRVAIDSINEVTVYAVLCAKRYGAVGPAERCVRAYLNRRPQPHLDRDKNVKPPLVPTPTTSPPKASHPKGDRGSGPVSHHTPSPPPPPKPPPKPPGHPRPPPNTPPPSGPPTITLPLPTTPACVLNLLCVGT